MNPLSYLRDRISDRWNNYLDRLEAQARYASTDPNVMAWNEYDTSVWLLLEAVEYDPRDEKFAYSDQEFTELIRMCTEDYANAMDAECEVFSRDW